MIATCTCRELILCDTLTLKICNVIISMPVAKCAVPIICEKKTNFMMVAQFSLF